MPIPVLIDCDPGNDDVIAIMLALASPEVDVPGITSVEGNQPVAETTENALRVVETRPSASDAWSRWAARSSPNSCRRCCPTSDRWTIPWPLLLRVDQVIE